MSTKKADLSPTALKDANGNFLLSNQDVQGLLRYCWTCALLPTTDTDYEQYIGTTDSGYKDLQKAPGVNIPALLRVYGNLKQHSTTFKDQSYPNIVNVASAIYNYAVRAGGKIQGSFYGDIIQWVSALLDENAKDQPDQDAVTRYTNNIHKLIDFEVASIDKIATASQKCVDDLKTFQGQLIQDKSDLATQDQSMTAALSSDDGRIATLKGQIKQQMDEINDDENEWERDTIIAATAITYAWLFPFGTIAAAVVIGVYTDKAIKLRRAIDALWGMIDTEGTELKADEAVAASLTCIVAGLEDQVKKVGSAIDVVGKMRGAWAAMKDDLLAIKSSVGDTLDLAFCKDVAEQNVQTILDQWNDIKGRADFFRQNAYVSQPPTRVTIAQVRAQMKDSS